MPIHMKGSGGAQEVPAISIDANGRITAKAGNKTSTMQLPTQAVNVITPGYATQTAVAKGYFATGDVYVSGDYDLLPQNIVSGVSIFGVAGSAKPAQSVSQMFYGDGTKTVSIYTNGIQFEKIMAICINARSAPVIEFAASTLIYVENFLAITIVKNYDGGDGFGVNGIPFNVVNSDGWITVDLPSNTATAFQDGLLYDVVVIGY